ncbi:MAG: glycosyl hydrolase [bacterium]|nr:glycosyl hydrolase [bacterium]
MKRMTVVVLMLTVLIIMPAAVLAKTNKSKAVKQGALKAETFTGLKLRNIGPSVNSGRISDIAVHPGNRSTWYVAAGSGGVWKTVNAGTTWTPIFQDQVSYSIGCVTIDPVNPDTIWVGTGENVSGRHVGFGDGVYKSLNGGKTWINMGLKKTERISKILVNPLDNNIIYLASEGPLWTSGGERGIYKSTDGGKNWERSLHISDNTGVIDVAFDPGNPDVIYAAAYQRRRSVAAFLAGGSESGIYKTTNAGKDWRRLDVGLPKGHMGRIGLSVSPIKPNVIYATIETNDKDKGFYRSEDRGESWEHRNTYISGGTGPHYYQEIYADPHEFDRVYQMDVWMRVTEDGGKTFSKVGGKYKHSDNHALAFDMIGHDPNWLLAGCDGGVYETWDRGKTWRFVANLPLTQFYKMALDNAAPFYNIHGGTQDNGSQLGPSRTLNVNGIANSDWIITLGADGHACAIDPANPDIIYGEFQQGFLFRYDKRSGESLAIQPQPEPGEEPNRWNWDTPLLISPHSNRRIYYGSHRLHRSDDRGNTWKRISPDLTRNINRLEQEIMGRKWSADDVWDHGAMSLFSTLTIISESPLKEGLIYTGSDDGLIQVTEDGGSNWRKIDKLPGVPDYFYVNDIKASLHEKNTVFAAMDNHKKGDFKPYLVKSTDRGKTWTSITGDLPKPLPVWSIAQDHEKAGLIFIGAEFGIYFTLDGGRHWVKIKGNAPTISFRDIEIQQRENDLVGASFGRGFFVLDDYTPLRHVDAKMLATGAFIFPVKKASMYIPKRPLELLGKAYMGDSYYLADNPPFGAVLTYYLKDSLKTAKQQRREKEKELEKQGKDAAFPGWDTLRQQEREEKPAVILTVKDESGQVVRQITGPVTAGTHRVAWDLRYPSSAPTELEAKEVDPWDLPPEGPLVVPGTFTVSIAKRVNGVLTPLGNTRTIVVESLELATLGAKDKQALLAYQRKAGKLQRAMMGAGAVITNAARQIAFIKKALLDTPDVETAAMGNEARRLERELEEMRKVLAGNRTLGRHSKAESPSLTSLLTAQTDTTAAITGDNKHHYDTVSARFGKLLKRLRRVVEIDLRKLSQQLEDAGAPWTPGRGVPKWEKE